MAWGEWMVPELSLAAEAQLASAKHTLLQEVHQHPEQVAELAWASMQQAAMLQSIMRKATARIAELELAEVLRHP